MGRLTPSSTEMGRTVKAAFKEVWKFSLKYLTSEMSVSVHVGMSSRALNM